MEVDGEQELQEGNLTRLPQMQVSRNRRGGFQWRRKCWSIRAAKNYVVAHCCMFLCDTTVPQAGTAPTAADGASQEDRARVVAEQPLAEEWVALTLRWREAKSDNPQVFIRR